MSCRLFRIRHLFWAAGTGLGISALALASVTYVVKKGDTLSQVSEKMVPGPVLGKNGSLERVLALNPNIKNPDLIYPGEQVQLPGGELAQASAERQPAQIVPEPSPEPSPQAAVDLSPKSPEAASVVQAPAPMQFKRGVYYTIAPFYDFATITNQDRSSGAPASLTTSYFTGADFSYGQKWTEGFRTFMHFKLAGVAFEAPTNGEGSISDTSKFLAGGGIGTESALSKSVTLGFSADYQQNLFTRGLDANNVTLDAIATPVLGANLSWDMITADPLAFGVSGMVAVDLPASTDGYRTWTGSSYGGSIYLKHLNPDQSSSSQADIGVFKRNQNTDITNQNETDVVFTLRLYFGGDK